MEIPENEIARIAVDAMIEVHRNSVPGSWKVAISVAWPMSFAIADWMWSQRWPCRWPSRE